MLNRRLGLFRYWLLGDKRGISIPEIINCALGPTCAPLAKRQIEAIEELDKYFIIRIRSMQYPLYWPKDFPLHALYQVITELFYENNWHYYEIPQTQVKKDDLVADCGASEGLFALKVIERCQKIYAFEPLPVFLNALKLTLGRFDNIEIMPFALSNRKGRATISLQDISSRIEEKGEGTSIDVTTIDDVFYHRNIPLNYLKGDLEGYDYLTLQGAYQTIKAYNPKIAITTYHHADHAMLISKYLKEINPDYQIKVKGIEHQAGAPVMLHAWVR